jgi:bacteriocin-like protein
MNKDTLFIKPLNTSELNSILGGIKKQSRNDHSLNLGSALVDHKYLGI